jgi:hypothetical protein
MTEHQIAELIKKHYGLSMTLHEILSGYLYKENKEGKMDIYSSKNTMFMILVDHNKIVVYYDKKSIEVYTETEEQLIKHLNHIFYVEQLSPLRLRRDYILSQILND